jgi:hypothetical protein
LLCVIFGLEFVEVYVVGVASVDDEAVAEDERFFAGEGDGMSAGPDGVLHRAFSAEYPLLGITGGGFVTENSQAAYRIVSSESAGEVQPGTGFNRGSLRLEGPVWTGERHTIGQSNPWREAAVGFFILGAADTNIIFESE